MSNAVSRLADPVSPILLREWVDTEQLLGVQSATPTRELYRYFLTPAPQMVTGSSMGVSAEAINLIEGVTTSLLKLPFIAMPMYPFVHSHTFDIFHDVNAEKITGWKTIPDAAVGSHYDWHRSIIAEPSVVVGGQKEIGISPSKCASWFQEVMESIDNLAGRDTNWDGDGGLPPNPSAVHDAQSFARLIAAQHKSCPTGVHAPNDGEIMFQWKRDGLFLEVGFYGDDSISWYAQHSGQESEFGDDHFDRNDPELPDGLIRALLVVG